MELIGAIVLFFVMASSGVLVGVFVVGTERNRLARERLAQAAAHEEAAERRHKEEQAHLNAAMEILAGRIGTLGEVLVRELRHIQAQRRNDLRLALGLTGGWEPSDGESGPESQRPSWTPGWGPPPRSATTPRAKGARDRSWEGELPFVLRDDDITPPSGWTLGQIRNRTAQPEGVSVEPAR